MLGNPKIYGRMEENAGDGPDTMPSNGSDSAIEQKFKHIEEAHVFFVFKFMEWQ